MIAAFNVSMDASNYSKQEMATGRELASHLATGEHQQIKNIAQIIQRVRPEIIVLNEFDYGEDS